MINLIMYYIVSSHTATSYCPFTSNGMAHLVAIIQQYRCKRVTLIVNNGVLPFNDCLIFANNFLRF